MKEHKENPYDELLPDACYSVLSSTGELIILKKNVDGYYQTDIFTAGKEEALEFADEYNGVLGVTKAQEKAMKYGSMFGWDLPLANPKNYDDDGNISIQTED